MPATENWQNWQGRFGMPLWAWILIIVLIVVALGGFGYSRY